MKRISRTVCCTALIAVTLSLTSCASNKVTDFFGNVFNKNEEVPEEQVPVEEDKDSSPETDSASSNTDSAAQDSSKSEKD